MNRRSFLKSILTAAALSTAAALLHVSNVLPLTKKARESLSGLCTRILKKQSARMYEALSLDSTFKQIFSESSSKKAQPLLMDVNDPDFDY